MHESLKIRELALPPKLTTLLARFFASGQLTSGFSAEGRFDLAFTDNVELCKEVVKLRKHYLKECLIVIMILAMGLLASSCMFLDFGPQNVATVRGTAHLEGETFHSGISVKVRYYDNMERSWVILAAGSTDSQGRFMLRDFLFLPEEVDFQVIATKDGYASADEEFAIYYGYDGSAFVFDMQLHNRKKLVVEWEFKAGASQGMSFVGSDKGQTTLYSYVPGYDSSRPYGVNIDNSGSSYDLSFFDDDDYQMSIYTSWRNVWALGNVPLNSISEIPLRSPDSSGYHYFELSVGMTYVVQTDYGYVKLRVLSLGNI